ncbi:hypothetical protein OEA41_000943 [Lepraria neglecta]|uniref:Uncharacterized protein n=1 Tax=Lepraria neglecta TaxID=209136 RepID=A0AAD9ZI38_9LECA|nr:hypothetical protein OEA41_000943 [Lepraria neglecta]
MPPERSCRKSDKDLKKFTAPKPKNMANNQDPQDLMDRQPRSKELGYSSDTNIDDEDEHDGGARNARRDDDDHDVQEEDDMQEQYDVL